MFAILALLWLIGDPQAAPRPQPTAPARPPASRPQPARPQPPADTYFVSTLTAGELQNKQAVLETSLGTIVLDLLADAAPNHVAHFITRARAGVYDGTIFHRVIANGIIQGGDPLSKDPALSARYGTGGNARAPVREERREDDAGLGRGGAGAEPARQRWFTVLHRDYEPADARRAVHDLRARGGKG